MSSRVDTVSACSALVCGGNHQFNDEASSDALSQLNAFDYSSERCFFFGLVLKWFRLVLNEVV